MVPNSIGKVVNRQGHIENLRSEAFFDWQSDDVVARWNNDNQPHR